MSAEMPMFLLTAVGGRLLRLDARANPGTSSVQMSGLGSDREAFSRVKEWDVLRRMVGRQECKLRDHMQERPSKSVKGEQRLNVSMQLRHPTLSRQIAIMLSIRSEDVETCAR